MKHLLYTAKRIYKQKTTKITKRKYSNKFYIQPVLWLNLRYRYLQLLIVQNFSLLRVSGLMSLSVFIVILMQSSFCFLCNMVHDLCFFFEVWFWSNDKFSNKRFLTNIFETDGLIKYKFAVTNRSYFTLARGKVVVVERAYFVLIFPSCG